MPIDDELELRIFEERHAELLHALTERNRDHLRTWLPWAGETRSIEVTRDFIRRGLYQFAGGNGFHAGIWFDGELVGSVGLHEINWRGRYTEIGYWLSQDAQGRGIMTRVVTGLLAYLFDELELNRVEILAATENTRSRAIPERLGFRHEGTLRQSEKLTDGYVDSAVYGLLAEEWKRRRE